MLLYSPTYLLSYVPSQFFLRYPSAGNRLTTYLLTKQDGISLLYACLQHFLDRRAECPKV